jgi:hypothetical protein
MLVSTCRYKYTRFARKENHGQGYISADRNIAEYSKNKSSFFVNVGAFKTLRDLSEILTHARGLRASAPMTRRDIKGVAGGSAEAEVAVTEAAEDSAVEDSVVMGAAEAAEEEAEPARTCD